MLAVGTIVAIQDNKFMVCGYRPYDNEGKVGMGHLLVPYPMGFMNAESLSLVSSDTVFPVVHEGFRNEDGESYDRMLEKIRTVGVDVTTDELKSVATEAVSELEADLAAFLGEVE